MKPFIWNCGTKMWNELPPCTQSVRITATQSLTSGKTLYLLYLFTHPMVSRKIQSAGEEKIFPIAQLGNRNKAVCHGSGVIFRALCSGTPGECHGGCGRWVPVTKQMDKVGNSPLLTDYGHLRQTRGGIYLLLAMLIRMFSSRKHGSTHLIR